MHPVVLTSLLMGIILSLGYVQFVEGVDPDMKPIIIGNEVCGDGNLEAGEQCDDGNTDSGDGCSDLCVIEFCGDGTIQAGIGEECDDTNMIEGDACRNNCMSAQCGDGIIWDLNASPPGLEQCDDGNLESPDGCTNMCLVTPCGEGTILQAGECVADLDAICGDGTTISNMMCVVSLAVGGYFAGIEHSALLLQATQLTAAWMIPVIVSGIGFAIVIARKF